jgi:hypothetical protein
VVAEKVPIRLGAAAGSALYRVVVVPDDELPATVPESRATPEPPTAIRAASVLVALQAVGLLTAGVVLLAESVVGEPSNRAGAVSAAVFAFVAAVALGFSARGLLRLRPSARTPVVVLEILSVPVAYQLAFDSERPEWGGPILICALAILYLLFTPPARAALDRPEPNR